MFALFIVFLFLGIVILPVLFLLDPIEVRLRSTSRKPAADHGQPSEDDEMYALVDRKTASSRPK
jgi:hypothetical protein